MAILEKFEQVLETFMRFREATRDRILDEHASYLSPVNVQRLAEALRDEHGRFIVWSGNIDAQSTGSSSLVFRLRDAPHLQEEVRNLQSELEDSIDDGQ